MWRICYYSSFGSQFSHLMAFLVGVDWIDYSTTHIVVTRIKKIARVTLKLGAFILWPAKFRFFTNVYKLCSPFAIWLACWQFFKNSISPTVTHGLRSTKSGILRTSSQGTTGTTSRLALGRKWWIEMHLPIWLSEHIVYNQRVEVQNNVVVSLSNGLTDKHSSKYSWNLALNCNQTSFSSILQLGGTYRIECTYKTEKKNNKKNFSYACLLLRASLKRSVKSKGFNPVSRFEALTWCMLCFGNQPPLTYWLQQQTLTLKKKQNPINGCKQKWPTYVWSNMEKNASQNHIHKIWWRMTTIRMIQL